MLQQITPTPIVEGEQIPCVDEATKIQVLLDRQRSTAARLEEINRQVVSAPPDDTDHDNAAIAGYMKDGRIATREPATLRNQRLAAEREFLRRAQGVLREQIAAERDSRRIEIVTAPGLARRAADSRRAVAAACDALVEALRSAERLSEAFELAGITPVQELWTGRRDDALEQVDGLRQLLRAPV